MRRLLSFEFNETRTARDCFRHVTTPLVFRIGATRRSLLCYFTRRGSRLTCRIVLKEQWTRRYRRSRSLRAEETTRTAKSGDEKTGERVGG